MFSILTLVLIIDNYQHTYYRRRYEMERKIRQLVFVDLIALVTVAWPTSYCQAADLVFSQVVVFTAKEKVETLVVPEGKVWLVVGFWTDNKLYEVRIRANEGVVNVIPLSILAARTEHTVAAFWLPSGHKIELKRKASYITVSYVEYEVQE